MAILVLVLHFASSRPLYRLDPAELSVAPAVPRQTTSVDRPPRVLQIVPLPSFVLPFEGDVR